MSYQRSYTVSKPPVGQITYGENKAPGWISTLRIFAVIGEIALTFALPGMGGAIAAGLAGATAQTVLDYVGGEGNAVSTTINFAASVLPVVGGEAMAARQTVRLGSKEWQVVHTQNFFANFG